MYGEIGVFYIGNEQVGGCLDWRISFETVADRGIARVSNWRIQASTYWIAKKSDYVLACFFWQEKNNLILAYKGKLCITSDSIIYGGRVDKSIELRRYGNGRNR